MVIDMSSVELALYNQAVAGKLEHLVQTLPREELGRRLGVLNRYLLKKQGAVSPAIEVMREAAKVLSLAHRRRVAHDAVRKAILWNHQAAA